LKIEELLKDDYHFVKEKKHKKHKAVDDDSADDENKDKEIINDERSIVADSLKELNKLSSDSQEHSKKEGKK